MVNDFHNQSYHAKGNKIRAMIMSMTMMNDILRNYFNVIAVNTFISKLIESKANWGPQLTEHTNFR